MAIHNNVDEVVNKIDFMIDRFSMSHWQYMGAGRHIKENAVRWFYFKPLYF
jgi:hypothetical protein